MQRKQFLYFTAIISALIICMSICISASNFGEHVLMYNGLDYKYVHQNFVSDYYNDGWKKAEINRFDKIVMYNAGNESIAIYPEDLDEYLSNGWAFNMAYFGTVTMYNESGTSKEVALSQVETYEKRGWSANKSDCIVTMYAPDGRTKEVGKNKVEEEKAVGWFVTKPVEMHSPDGITQYVEQTDVDTYKANGWYIISFSKNRQYNNSFLDVPSSAWYAKEVASAYELGFIDGISDSTFSPDTTVTVAQGITIASRVHATLYGNTINSTSSRNWYDMYVSYAKSNGFVREGQFDSYTRNIARFEMAELFHDAMPNGYYVSVNYVIGIPDVSKDEPYYNKLLTLYNAGIIMGSDDYGTFKPRSSIKRSECAAIINRVAIPENRIKGELKVRTVTLYAPDGRTKDVPEYYVLAELAVGWSTKPFTGNEASTSREVLNSEQIYAKCSPAVFTILATDLSESYVSQGSGFFINDSGVAITNYHVIEDCYLAAAYITGSDTAYEISGVYAYDKENDWAVIQVNCSGNAFLKIGEKETIVGGAVVYAIGTPKGFSDTISQGIISNPKREMDGYTYIQTDTAMTNGNSGGALINKYGDVIGINTLVYGDGSLGINFAVPVYEALNYSQDKLYTLGEISGGAASIPSQMPNQPQNKPSTEHQAIINHIISNGEYDADSDYYYISYTYYSTDYNRYYVSLNYNADSGELILGCVSDNTVLLLYLVDNSSSYEYYVTFEFDDGSKAKALGKVYAGHDLTNNATSSVSIDLFEIDGEEIYDTDIKNAMKGAVASITILSVVIADNFILNNTDYSLTTTYNLK